MSSLRYHVVVQRFPVFRLDDADGEVVTNRDLLGHPAVVYLARHPG
jgi:peroxiredoxin